MAERDDNDDVQKQLDEALRELMPIVLEAAGGSIDADVEAFWKERYEARFRKAIEKKGREYELDRETLMKRARKLGLNARKQAGSGSIQKQHAEVASEETDCPPEIRMVDWCS